MKYINIRHLFCSREKFNSKSTSGKAQSPNLHGSVSLTRLITRKYLRFFSCAWSCLCTQIQPLFWTLKEDKGEMETIRRVSIHTLHIFDPQVNYSDNLTQDIKWTLSHVCIFWGRIASNWWHASAISSTNMKLDQSHEIACTEHPLPLTNTLPGKALIACRCHIRAKRVWAT